MFDSFSQTLLWILSTAVNIGCMPCRFPFSPFFPQPLSSQEGSCFPSLKLRLVHQHFFIPSALGRQRLTPLSIRPNWRTNQSHHHHFFVPFYFPRPGLFVAQYCHNYSLRMKISPRQSESSAASTGRDLSTRIGPLHGAPSRPRGPFFRFRAKRCAPPSRVSGTEQPPFLRS